MARKRGLENFGTHRAKPFKKGGGRRQLTKGEKAATHRGQPKRQAHQGKS